MQNRLRRAEPVIDALRLTLVVGRPRAGKRRIGHGDPWKLLTHTTRLTAKPQMRRRGTRWDGPLLRILGYPPDYLSLRKRIEQRQTGKRATKSRLAGTSSSLLMAREGIKPPTRGFSGRHRSIS
jgi:hypothetical protein